MNVKRSEYKRIAAWIVGRISNHAIGSQAADWIDHAIKIEIESEKRHRAMGARFTGGRIRAAMSVRDAATCLIAHNVAFIALSEPGTHVPTSWGDAASMRHSRLLAWAVGEILMDRIATAGTDPVLGLSRDELDRELSTIAAFDYAKDAA